MAPRLQAHIAHCCTKHNIKAQKKNDEIKICDKHKVYKAAASLAWCVVLP